MKFYNDSRINLKPHLNDGLAFDVKRSAKYIYVLHLYGARKRARLAKVSQASPARNSYLNTSGSRLILAFRNSGRRRIYSIAETRDTFEQWRRMLINRMDARFSRKCQWIIKEKYRAHTQHGRSSYK